jgi:hypothetical protein
MGGPPAWRLGVGLTTLHRKNKLVAKTSKEPMTWTDLQECVFLKGDFYV